MSTSFPGRTQLEIEDVWSVGEGETEGKPIVLRFRPSLREIAGHPEFPERMTVAWDYGDSEIGMPDPDAVADMDDFEDRLIEIFEHDKQAVLVAVITHAGLREWIFYTSDQEVSIERVNEEFGSDEPYPIEFMVESDPNWEEYTAILDNCVEGDDADDEA